MELQSRVHTSENTDVCIILGFDKTNFKISWSKLWSTYFTYVFLPHTSTVRFTIYTTTQRFYRFKNVVPIKRHPHAVTWSDSLPAPSSSFHCTIVPLHHQQWIKWPVLYEIFPFSAISCIEQPSFLRTRTDRRASGERSVSLAIWSL